MFIDEIDAIGTKRYDSNSGGEREIQRTMLELLNQLDGFDSRGDVKVLMATNRKSLATTMAQQCIYVWVIGIDSLDRNFLTSTLFDSRRD